MESPDELTETPPKETPTYRELLQQEESIWKKTVMVMVLVDHIDIRDPLIEGEILIEVGDPLTKEDILMEEDPMMVEGHLEEDTPMEMGDPLEGEDTLVEDLLMDMEDPLMEEDHLDLLVDEDHLALKDFLDQ